MKLSGTWQKAMRILGLARNRQLVQLAPTRRTNPLVSKIGEDPLNPLLHLQNARSAFASGNASLAYAELKTARHLGLDGQQFQQYSADFMAALPAKSSMSHNTYFRLQSLADELVKRANGADFAVLDVGGGSGPLAAFLPEHAYCLAEPLANGISGTNLPFADRSFDFVVSCHVLEHITPDDRELFLDQLLAKASVGLILLNPFEVPNTLASERLQLVIDVTGADWAREHLHCSLPRITDLQAYAAARGLHIDIQPNGTMTTSLAFVFMQHFAALAGCKNELQQVESFFNRNYQQILDSDTCPNAYLVFIEAAAASRYSNTGSRLRRQRNR